MKQVLEYAAYALLILGATVLLFLLVLWARYPFVTGMQMLVSFWPLYVGAAVCMVLGYLILQRGE